MWLTFCISDVNVHSRVFVVVMRYPTDCEYFLKSLFTRDYGSAVQMPEVTWLFTSHMGANHISVALGTV